MRSFKSIFTFIGAFFLIIIGILVVLLKLVIIIPLVIIFFILSLFGFKFRSFIKTFRDFKFGKKKKKENNNKSRETIDVEYKIKE
jgi:UPF0716 family protein affecting phage T7 exclusion